MIVIVDDEIRYAESIVDELVLSGYEVFFKKKVDVALSFFEEHKTDIELLILDIMMPPGNAFKDVDTDSGLRTGVHFFERIRQKLPHLPIIILTNVSDERAAARFMREPRCRFYQKKDYFSRELVDKVREMLVEDQDH